MKKGKFIAIYGINNIGKTTQSKRLVDNLKKAGYDTVYFKYPVYNMEPSGPFINSVLRSHGKQKISEEELQLWFVINRYQNQKIIEDHLAEGKIIVAEDYTGTGLAWGTAKGVKQSWLESINSNLLKEDLAIMLEGRRFLRAKESVHVHEQNDDLVEQCRLVHEKLALKYNWKRLLVRKDVNETSSLIWDIVSSFLEKSEAS